VTDLMPCEDGHARTLLAATKPGELWIGDRLFCTRPAILAANARSAAVLFREQASNPQPSDIGPRRRIGRLETGVVDEQDVTIPTGNGDEVLELRRIEDELDTPTTNGDRVIRLLTTLPASVEAQTVAHLHRKRWTNEGLFGRQEAALHSEVRTLGYPRAALLAFGLAVVAFNALSVIEVAIAAAHDLADAGLAVSSYYVADDVRTDDRGMLIAIDASAWEAFDAQTPRAGSANIRAGQNHRNRRATPRAPASSATSPPPEF
jgi:hypothetical protein